MKRTEATLPRWFTIALTGVLVFTGTAGLIGIASLVVHAYQPLLVSVIAVGAALGSAWLVATTSEPESVSSHGPALAALGIALIFFALAGSFHSEHLLVDRDPGAYINSGRAIAAGHSLPSVTRSGPFEDRQFFVSSPAFNESSGEQTWFLPMLSVLLALGWAAGGYTGMFLVGPLLGTLGLLVCYALSSRLVGPRWAVLVPVLLAINPLQPWFGRDAYSELVVQVVALGGIWLYLHARSIVSPRIAAISAALIATSVLARLDALAIVACLVGFAALEWVRCDDAKQPNEQRRVVAAFALMLLGVAFYCTVITKATSRAYLAWHRNSTRPLHFLVLAAIGFGAAWIIAHRLRPGLGRRLAHARLPFAIGCAFVIGACVWAYVWRPASPSAAFPLKNILTDLPNHAAWASAQRSWSARWLVEWFGIFAVLLAIYGVLTAARRALRGDVAATVFVVLVVPLAIVYILRPNVSPEQPWAMRRFLPIVIPGLVIAATVGLHDLTNLGRRVSGAWQRVLAYAAIFVLAAAVLTQNALAAAPLVEARAQHGATNALKELCTALPNDAAVLIFPASYLDNQMPQTIRGFCEVPTARAPTEPNLDIAGLAAEWQSAGRRLYIVTATPQAIGNPTHARLRVVLRLEIDDRYEPELSYRVRPQGYRGVPRRLWLLQPT